MNFGPPIPWGEKSQVPTTRDELFDPLIVFRRELDRMFDDFFKSFGGGQVSSSGWQTIAPAIDLTETDKELIVTAELPGLDEKDIEVKVSNQTLTIRGEKKEDREEKEKDYHLSERRYGSFQRSFRLPEGIDEDGIGARFAKGVLTVTLPKTTQAQTGTKKIDVKPA